VPGSLQGEIFMSDITIYQSDDGQARLEMQLDQETVWLTEKPIRLIFSTSGN